MKIYLDSAQINSWKLPAGCPAIQGVTTNPSLVFQAGLPVNLATYLQLIQTAADHGFAELMLQLPTNDATLALQWLDQLRPAAETASVRITIKLPCHPDWLPTIAAVQAKGQPILLTGLSNPVQLLWAKSLKAAFVAPTLADWSTTAATFGPSCKPALPCKMNSSVIKKAPLCWQPVSNPPKF